MNQMIQTEWITLSERVYRALLILYPADYRREYGVLMVQMFRDVCRDKYRTQGLAGVVLWWCKTLLDLALTVIEQRRKVSFVMSKSTFVQLTGIFLIVGGALNGLAAFSQFQPGDHYSYNGVYQLLIWLFAPGSLLISLGCVGLALRYDYVPHKLSQWMLYLAAIGSLVMVVGLVATSVDDSLWDIGLAGIVLHTIGLTAFGLLHLRTPVLPIFRALPLQMAGGLLVMWLGILRTDSQTTNNTLSFLLFFGMGLAWLAIGMAVNRQQRDTPPTVMSEGKLQSQPPTL